jgi:hypothetical protein
MVDIYVTYSIFQLILSHQKLIKLKFTMNTLMLTIAFRKLIHTLSLQKSIINNMGNNFFLKNDFSVIIKL